MKKIGYIAFGIILLSIGCKTDDVETPYEGTVELRVAATFDGEGMQIFENYVNISDHPMYFEQVRLYLSDIALVRQNGTELMLSEIEFFNFDGEAISRFYTVPPGNYTGIRYHIGVPQRMNGTDNEDFLTSQYGPDSPLNVQNGMYWSWQAGYRFLIYEGRVDITPSDPDDLAEVFAIHLGKDAFYTDLEATQAISVEDGQTRVIGVDWDLAKNIYNESDTLHLGVLSDSQFHGGELELAARFQNLMRGAFTVSVQ